MHEWTNEDLVTEAGRLPTKLSFTPVGKGEISLLQWSETAYIAYSGAGLKFSNSWPT